MTRHTPLDRVRRFSTMAQEALGARDVQIRDAHRQGESLRKIAEAAGISHEQVRRIVSR